jgi:hypothetical protein
MLRRLAVLFVLLIHGCATREICTPQLFLKPEARGGRADYHPYFPARVSLKVTDDISVDVSVCVKNDESPMLCLDTYPTNEQVLRFAGRQLMLSPIAGEPRESVPLTRITYNVWCRGPKLEGGQCESSTESPIQGGHQPDIRRVHAAHVGQYVYLDEYSFSPELSFTGARVRVGLNSFWRRYQALTEPLPKQFVQNGFRVALPAIQLGERTYELPDVSFRRVGEDVCRPANRPLSLQ